VAAIEVDAVFMEQALELAARGRGFTSPNPVVGAVVVKDGAVVGAGYHERFGASHAEPNALREAGPLARGATIYVTLEPCCVWGNTPPCTEAIIAAGVARVVAATRDPNPAVDGKGLGILREAGVDVDEGLFKDRADDLIAPYRKFRREGLPRVVLKLAMSLDGRIARPPGESRWVSSEASRELVHSMRSEADCVMVGIGTVLADDPLLTDRRPDGGARQPSRLVLDGALRTPVDSALVAGATEVPTVVACGGSAPRSKEDALAARGVEVWRVAEGDGGLDLTEVLARTAAAGSIDVLSEGGARVARSLLEADLVDRVAFFFAPERFGPQGVPAFADLPDAWWERGRRLEGIRFRDVGGDRLLMANVVRPTGAAAGHAARGHAADGSAPAR